MNAGTKKLMIVSAALMTIMGSTHYAIAAQDPTNIDDNSKYNQQLDQLYAEARKEGSVMWYTASVPDVVQATIAGFKNKYPGIDVQFLRLSTGQITVRYAQERESGVVNADLISAGDQNFFETGTEKGWFMSHPIIPEYKHSKWPAELLDKGVTNRIEVLLLNVAYNTNLVTGDNVPTTWEDFLKPFWKGKFAIGKPATVPAYLQQYQMLADQYGDSFLRKLKQQDPDIVQSTTPSIQSMAAGGLYAVLQSYITAVKPLQSEGAPIEMVALSPSTGIEHLMAASEGAKHPAAAQLLYNYALSPEGQFELAAGKGGTSVLGKKANVAPLPNGYVGTWPPAKLNDSQKNVLNLLDIRD